MHPLVRQFSTVLVTAVLVACASEGPPQRVGRGGPDAARRPEFPNVFISPAGRPFRAPVGSAYPVGDWFAVADADHDGRLTQDEFRADAEKLFRELDKDGDGVISGLEVAAYEQTIVPEILPRIAGLRRGEGLDPDLDLGDANNTGRTRGRERGGRGSSGPPQERPAQGGGDFTQGAAMFSLLNEPEPVAAADSAFDGRITLAEFQAAADRRFTVLDTKARGYLTLQDLPKTPVQLAIERNNRRRPPRRP